ncbi:hypothetical protein IAT38_000408 [Cryptococcus sp. DSM 104549]
MEHDEGDYSHDEEPDVNVKREPKDNDKGKDTGKGGNNADGKDKKSTINRVNRACNNCRRMKMRCVGAEEPPCKRCKNGGLECVMEKPGRASGGGDNGAGEDRIRSLESQVSSIQNTLTELVTTLRAGMSSSASNGSAQTPVAMTSTTPDYAPPVGLPLATANLAGFAMGVSPPSGTVDPGNHFRHTSVSSVPSVGQARPFFPAHHSAGPYLSQGSPALTNPQDPFRPYVSNTHNQSFGFSPQAASNMPPPPQRRPNLIDDAARRQSMPVSTTPGPSGWMGGSGNTPTNPPSTNPPAAAEPHTRHMSLPPSRAGSVGPPDIFGPEEIINPLGEMSNMAGLVEAAVERAREEQAKKNAAAADGGVAPSGSGDTPHDPGMKRPATSMDMERGLSEGKKPAKRTKFEAMGLGYRTAKGPTVMDVQNLPPRAVVPGFVPLPTKLHHHAYPDAVSEGYVSEEEGRELMKVFYAGSSNFIPCYDPSVDTWESLRVRSPFSITAIIWVGARIRDGGGPLSEVQKACRAHAEKIAVGTMFHPVHRIEAVQSMILLSAFQDNGWLPGGHAVRMAVDMGINRSFIHLLRTGMGKNKTKEELEAERSLVVHSRTWFGLYLMEHQMAYGTGRPAIIREDETIHQCRRLLEHPLSITSDARLVSTVELTALRSPLHIELTAAPDLPIVESTLRRLKQANSDFDAWERYWDRILSDRFAKGKGDFFRESLIIQRQYAELFVNSQLLRGIREPTDVVGMPEEKRALAIRAMKNAQKCLHICLHGENYRNGLRYAVHYTHVCAAFAASFLIRIARLFPHELNLKKTAKDIEELASILSDIPAGRYARSLRLILRKARRQKVIPAPSAIPSPNRLAAPLPAVAAFSPSQLVNPSFYAASPANSVHPGGTPSVGGIPSVAGQVSQVSPNSNMLLNATSQIINDSPSSAEFFEFDSLFAQETLERAGIQLGENDQLPLFLDGQSLGASAGPTDTAPYVGLEQFFLPQEVDNRLVGPGMGGSGQEHQGEGSMPGDVWW